MRTKTNQIDRRLGYSVNQQNIRENMTLPMLLPVSPEGVVVKTRLQNHPLLKLLVDRLMERKKLLSFSKRRQNPAKIPFIPGCPSYFLQCSNSARIPCASSLKLPVSNSPRRAASIASIVTSFGISTEKGSPRRNIVCL